MRSFFRLHDIVAPKRLAGTRQEPSNFGTQLFWHLIGQQAHAKNPAICARSPFGNHQPTNPWEATDGAPAAHQPTNPWEATDGAPVAHQPTNRWEANDGAPAAHQPTDRRM